MRGEFLEQEGDLRLGHFPHEQHVFGHRELHQPVDRVGRRQCQEDRTRLFAGFDNILFRELLELRVERDLFLLEIGTLGDQAIPLVFDHRFEQADFRFQELSDKTRRLRSRRTSCDEGRAGCGSVSNVAVSFSWGPNTSRDFPQSSGVQEALRPEQS